MNLKIDNDKEKKENRKKKIFIFNKKNFLVIFY